MKTKYLNLEKKKIEIPEDSALSSTSEYDLVRGGPDGWTASSQNGEVYRQPAWFCLLILAFDIDAMN